MEIKEDVLKTCMDEAFSELIINYNGWKPWLLPYYLHNVAYKYANICKISELNKELRKKIICYIKQNEPYLFR